MFLKFFMSFILALFIALPVNATQPYLDKNSPFCAEVNELHKFFLAFEVNDIKRMQSIKACTITKERFRLEVISEEHIENNISVIKGRLIGSEDSGVGYTMNIFIENK